MISTDLYGLKISLVWSTIIYSIILVIYCIHSCAADVVDVTKISIVMITAMRYLPMVTITEPEHPSRINITEH